VKDVLAYLKGLPLQTRVLVGVALGVIVLLVGSIRGCGVARDSAAALAAARHAEMAALDSAARSAATAALERQRGDSARAAAVSERGRADSVENVADSLAITYRVTAASAPAQCSSVVRTANAALAAASVSHLELELTVHSALTADSLHVSALDTSALALNRLRVSSVTLVKASRPSLLLAVLPRPGIGATLGYDPIRKQPAVVIGVTLGWHF